MLEKYIRLNSIEEVKKFVAVTSSKDYNITLESDEYVVDAKSIMGVLSLDLTKQLKVVADCKMVAELTRQLEEFR